MDRLTMMDRIRALHVWVRYGYEGPGEGWHEPKAKGRAAEIIERLWQQLGMLFDPHEGKLMWATIGALLPIEEANGQPVPAEREKLWTSELVGLAQWLARDPMAVTTVATVSLNTEMWSRAVREELGPLRRPTKEG